MARLIVPSRRVWTRQPQGAVEIGDLIKPVLAFNFSQSRNPENLAGGQRSWSNSGTAPSLSATAGGLGASNGGAASSWSSYWPARSFDGFSPANSPATFVFSFVGGQYVNNGSGANVIWLYGAVDSGTGFSATVNSSSVLRVRLANTEINGPTLSAHRLYHCVAGRDSAGNCWLWVNGVLSVSGTGATAADSASPNTFQIFGDNTGSRAFSGRVLMFAMGSANPATFGALLSANPWQIFRQRPRIAYTLDQSIGSVQLLAPIADISKGAWSASSGSDLYPMLDEATADDFDYIVATSATSCEMRLTAGSTPTTGDHILRYRLLSGTGAITARLKQGSTTIASWGPHTLTGAAQDFAQTLTGGQVAAITDYGDLRVVFEAN